MPDLRAAREEARDKQSLTPFYSGARGWYYWWRRGVDIDVMLQTAEWRLAVESHRWARYSLTAIPDDDEDECLVWLILTAVAARRFALRDYLRPGTALVVRGGG